ncbi:MAG: NAD(P)-binding domain-containing protein, partial [Euryarchaeota archaeon]|nr:NAD(P)-binding domain-containing protein [Euryarchaeota archaeon]
MKIGIIGTGRIGEALIRGVLAADLCQGDRIFASDVDEERLDALHSELGINVSTDNTDTIGNAETIILAIKPQIIASVLQSVKPQIEGALVISVAA